jgi:endonuclease I
MAENKNLNKIDAYLSSSLSDEEKKTFIDAVKKDVDLLKDLELSRAVAIKIRSEEKKRLVDRFKEEYNTKQGAPTIPFSDEKDDRILEYMNAAFVNTNLSENKNSIIDWETIVQFLEGEDDDK